METEIQAFRRIINCVGGEEEMRRIAQLRVQALTQPVIVSCHRVRQCARMHTGGIRKKK